MHLGEASIVIRLPIADVFSFVADGTKDPLWHTTVVEVRRTSPTPLGLGATFDGVYDSHKGSLDTPPDTANFQRFRATITEYVPNRSTRLTVVFTDPPRGTAAWVMGRSFALTFRFEPVPEGTRVYRNGEFHPTPLIWPLLPLIARASRRRNRYLLANLRRAVERGETGRSE